MPQRYQAEKRCRAAEAGVAEAAASADGTVEHVAAVETHLYALEKSPLRPGIGEAVLTWADRQRKRMPEKRSGTAFRLHEAIQPE